MLIKRHNRLYKLTPEEIRRAHDEYQHDMIIQDIQSKYKLNNAQANMLVDAVERALDKNEELAEDYWLTIEHCVDDYMNHIKEVNN